MKHILFIASLFLVFSCSEPKNPIIGKWVNTTFVEDGIEESDFIEFYEDGTWDWDFYAKKNDSIIMKVSWDKLNWKDISSDKNSYSFGKIKTNKNDRVYLLYDEFERKDSGIYEYNGEIAEMGYNYHYTVISYSDDFNSVLDGYNWCVVRKLGTESEICADFKDDIRVQMDRILN